MSQPLQQAGNVSERIVSQIEELLASEQLKPGERLPTERDMAELLGASRPSVREAVRVLQAQGLLVVKHGLGVVSPSRRPSARSGWR